MKNIILVVLVSLFTTGCATINNFCKNPKDNVLINYASSANPLAVKYGTTIICVSYDLVSDVNTSNYDIIKK